jgi:DNA polymerase III subunit chi
LTTIDFYFNAAERLAVACRLAGKALRQGKRVLVHAPQAEVAQAIDRMLWTWQAISFVPHCYAGDALAGETPVLIATAGEPAAAEPLDVLLNLGPECPPGFERHPRVLEIVSLEAEERRAGRGRYAFYRDRGYEIRNHDLAREARE